MATFEIWNDGGVGIVRNLDYYTFVRLVLGSLPSGMVIVLFVAMFKKRSSCQFVAKFSFRYFRTVGVFKKVPWAVQPDFVFATFS